jgi:thiamine-phosphate pyrophosphorylase
VTEPRRRFGDLVTAVAAAADGGVDWVQLRDKSASAGTMYAQAQALRDALAEHDAQLAVNDRLDVALAVGAAGVHLAGQSLPVDAAVRLAEQRLLVGRSVHDLEEACAAARDGADYLTFGHVFPTASHEGVPPRGLAQLAEIVQAVDVPVLAIGGVTTRNLDQTLATGCAGIAVISAILADPNPRTAAARLREALDASPHTPRRPFPGVRPARAAHRQPANV